MQNMKRTHLEKEISHLLANNEITDHHKLLPDSSYLDMLQILFQVSIFLANESLRRSYLHSHLCISSSSQAWIVKQKPAEYNSITFTICGSKYPTRVFWNQGLKNCYVHRAEIIFEVLLKLSSFLFIASLGHCIVTFKIAHRERSLKIYNISFAPSCVKSLLIVTEKG